MDTLRIQWIRAMRKKRAINFIVKIVTIQRHQNITMIDIY